MFWNPVLSLWDILLTLYLYTLFFQMASNTIYRSLFVVDNTVSLSLLMTIIQNVFHVQSACTTSDMCCFKYTRGISSNISVIPTASIYPEKCQRTCSKRPECTGTTHDRTIDNCELYSDCPTPVTDMNFSFCMTKSYEGPCRKVRCETRANALWYYMVKRRVYACLLKLPMSSIRTNPGDGHGNELHFWIVSHFSGV